MMTSCLLVSAALLLERCHEKYCTEMWSMVLGCP